MYRKREAKIADAIRTDSSKDKFFSYIVLFVISLVVVVMGYVLSGLITSLSKHMENVVLNINTMSSSMQLMQKDMTTMTNYIQSMDKNTNTMSIDIHQLNSSITQMSTHIDSMDANTKNIEEEMSDMNKLNPMNLF